MTLRRRGYEDERPGQHIKYKIPKFKTYDEVELWIKKRAPLYGGKSNFRGSKEYEEAWPQIQKLYKEKQKKKGTPKGFKVGKRVKKFFAGMFMSVRTVKGVCKIYRGNHMVYLDKPIDVSMRGRVVSTRRLSYDETWEEE